MGERASLDCSEKSHRATVNQAKSLQLRHEMIIRNSDSGKIMGVKGRRVALVEQMTNTVISFQKVDPKSKERTLTITASSMEDIERAKDLIIDTIKRNMSPIRADATGHDSPAEEDENENDISIETTHDGMLKLCCSDPQVLQAAQEALSQYLRSRARPSAAERELRKERRKSMPLQASQPEPAAKPLTRTFHGSTPNLAEAGLEAEKKTIESTKNYEVGSSYGNYKAHTAVKSVPLWLVYTASLCNCKTIYPRRSAVKSHRAIPQPFAAKICALDVRGSLKHQLILNPLPYFHSGNICCLPPAQCLGVASGHDVAP
ncbi:KH domain protein [Teladorsagia circumcincta]|uniref:KH domain protein n=1 Tax=Teladorsagia circumcincta TaxID=45464 RepID=A0A2G9TQ92_TELCI|nr:KH domain protein [Teladorsagia circumcincta]